MSIATQIKEKITHSLAPTHLEVLNESHQHNVPKGSESHFRLVVVSEEFEEKNRVQRHRLLNKLLEVELAESIHALALQLYTPSEWENGPGVNKSPDCLGGNKL